MADTSNPLPEREQNVLLATVKDIMNNGSRMPQDVSNQLIMAAIIELNSCVKANANLLRANTIRVRWLSAILGVVGSVVLALVAVHAKDSEFVQAILGIFGA